MKSNLQYTSKLDKKYIKEASKLKSNLEAKDKGWKYIGKGAYKDTYKKGNIVVKFNRSLDNNKHMLNEIKFYKKTKKTYKKYLARIFGGDGEKIVQKFVPYNKNRKYSDNEQDKMYRLASKVGVRDVYPGQNMVKVENKIIFYDFAGQMIQ